MEQEQREQEGYIMTLEKNMKVLFAAAKTNKVNAAANIWVATIAAAQKAKTKICQPSYKVGREKQANTI
jgi:hypothetical protein